MITLYKSSFLSIASLLCMRNWRAGLIATLVVTGLSVVGTPRAMAQITFTPNGGYISFNLGPGASSPPITLPADIPWHVSGTTTTTGYRGVGEVEIERSAGNFLQWIGLNSNASGTVTQGFSGSPGTHIVQIDFSGLVNLVVAGPDSFVVTNSASFSETGYVSWTGFGNTFAGGDNTALGAYALLSNTTGTSNSASGYGALYSNTTGSYNTASGLDALEFNTSGSSNTAYGFAALAFNQNGNSNTAAGYAALYQNKTGAFNTATGYNALLVNNGSYNTAYGQGALRYNTSGNSNIAVGVQAGRNVMTGSNNIDIGNVGTTSDNNTTRIGTQGTQTAAYIAGINNTKITGSAVYVTSSGQLGVLASSERYKTAVAPMGSNTAKLDQLRPVTFRLKSDAQGTLQYGLIAEEVAKVYPELVIRDEKGRIDGVRYDELAPMLLNEVQKEHKTIATLVQQHDADTVVRDAQTAKLDSQAAKIASLERQLAGIQAALIKLQSTDHLVARR